MVIERGEIWWAFLPEPRGSVPGFKHPILIVQADFFNRSSISTVIGVIITSNLRLSSAPGNILISKRVSSLPHDSVVNVSQIVTIDKNDLLEYVGRLSDRKLAQIEKGLRLVLSL